MDDASAPEAPLVIRFLIEPGDYEAISAIAERTVHRAMIGFGLLFIGVAALDWWAGLGAYPEAAVGGVLLVVLGWSRLIDRLLIRHRTRGLVGAECELRFDGEAVSYRQAGMEGRILWSVLTDFREDRRAILLFQGRLPAVSIPKRVLTEGDERRLRAYLGANVTRRPVPAVQKV